RRLPRDCEVVGAAAAGSRTTAALAALAITGRLLRGIEGGLEFVHGSSKLIGTAEESHDVCHGAMPRDWRYSEHVGQGELSISMLRVLLQQLVQYLTSLWAEAGEEVLTCLT